MRLLLDQNLSHRLTVALADVFPGSMHVRDLGLAHADDEARLRRNLDELARFHLDETSAVFIIE
jgi:predicted nuclease of predicted toxin-antitoxin system